MPTFPLLKMTLNVSLKSSISRKSGEEKATRRNSLIAIAKYWFEHLSVTKIHTAIFGSNEYMKQCLKECGFKFNKTTTGSSESRHIYYLYKNDFEWADQASTVPSTNPSVSSPALSSLPKIYQIIAPSGQSPSRLSSISSVGRSLGQSASVREFLVRNTPDSNSDIQSLYFYRSSRYKNNVLMDSVKEMEQEILRESKSLEDLKASAKRSTKKSKRYSVIQPTYITGRTLRKY